MANDTELLAALRAAHDAGDEDAAIKIAQQMSAAPVTPEVEKPVDTGTHFTAPGPADQPGGSNWMAKYGPTAGMSNSDKFWAGAGQSVYDTGRGLAQLVGLRNKGDTDAQRSMDAPLDQTGAGLAGNIAGGVAQSVIPGMGAEALGTKIAAKLGTSPGALQAAQAVYRITRPAATGAGYGAIAPVGTGETRAGNAGIGAVAGEIGGVAGDAANSVFRTGEDALSKGARLGADIAKKYNIPLSMPQLAGGFTGFVGSALDKLPFSGASERADAQRGAFNDALGRTAGIPDAEGAINHDMTDTAQDTVGKAIGNMAKGHTAFVTQNNVNDVTNLLSDVNRKATAENAKIVNNWAEDLYGMGQAGPSKVVPINNPLPGGPIGQIPGDAWREQNTALGQHIRRLGPNDGDLKYYLGQLQDSYMDSMHAGMTPDEQDVFGALRGMYRNNKTIQPLAEKAGDAGINPQLVQSRAIAAKNNRGDVGELGDFAKNWLASKYPDSGTAQRALLYSALVGGAGAAGNEIFGSGEGDGQHENSAYGGIAPVAATVLGGLAGRGLSSNLVSKYAQARLPDAIGEMVQRATATAPVAADKVVQDAQTAGPQPAMAEGGEVQQSKKSTFWDLVSQAVKEATGSSEQAATPSPNTGNQASGQVGQDFDNRVSQGVSSNE
jgi:hypothetical protein